MMNFKCHTPDTIEEVLQLLNTKDNIAIIAGGTDIIVQLKDEKVFFEQLVSLRYLNDLKEITLRPNGDLKIGAMSTISDVINSSLVTEFNPSIKEALFTLGSKQIRNIATIGGNLCNASPAADSAPILLSIDSLVELTSFNGVKIIPLKEFFVGNRETVLQRGEILSAIILPAEAKNLKSTYLKLGIRQSCDIAVASIAIALKIKNGICMNAKIALGSVANKPIRAEKTEKLLQGISPLENLEQIAESAMEESAPITDIRATADYRKDMVRVLLKRGMLTIC